SRAGARRTRARLCQRGGAAGRSAFGGPALGGDDLQELANVDPRLEADHPEGPRRVAGTGDRRAARLSGGEGDGGVAGLYRGTKGVRREAAAEMAGKVGTRSVIASEAKQSRAERGTLDCFVASLLAMTEYAAMANPYVPTPAYTPHNPADRPPACPSWSATDARQAPASAGPSRRWRSCRRARGAIRSAFLPCRATGAAARPHWHRSHPPASTAASPGRAC